MVQEDSYMAAAPMQPTPTMQPTMQPTPAPMPPMQPMQPMQPAQPAQPKPPMAPMQPMQPLKPGAAAASLPPDLLGVDLARGRLDRRRELAAIHLDLDHREAPLLDQSWLTVAAHVPPAALADGAQLLAEGGRGGGRRPGQALEKALAGHLLAVDPEEQRLVPHLLPLCAENVGKAASPV